MGATNSYLKFFMSLYNNGRDKQLPDQFLEELVGVYACAHVYHNFVLSFWIMTQVFVFVHTFALGLTLLEYRKLDMHVLWRLR